MTFFWIRPLVAGYQGGYDFASINVVLKNGSVVLIVYHLESTSSEAGFFICFFAENSRYLVSLGKAYKALHIHIAPQKARPSNLRCIKI